MNKSSRKQRQVVVATWRKISLRLLLYATLLYCSFAQNCPKDLENTVVYEGNATLFLRANNSDKVKWQVAPSSAVSGADLPMDLTDYNDKVLPPFDTPPNLYAANSSGLTISNANGAPQGGANYSTAGMYTLNYQDPPNCVTAAGLVVIISGPVCSVDTSDPAHVKLTCSVSYASYRNQQINPIMTWKDSSGTVMTEDQPERITLSDDNQGLQNATSKYPIGSADTNTYECQMTFSAPPPELPDFIAKNAPNYKQSCFAHYVMETTTAMETTTVMETTAVPTTTSAYDTSTTTQSTTATITTTAATTTTTTTSMAATTTTTALASSSSSPSTVSPDSPLTVSPILSSSSSASSANPASATSSTSSPGPSPISSSPPSSSVPPVQVPTYPMEPTPASTTISAALGSNAETQALAMVLSLSLASVLLAGVVCGCWYFCCCPNPVGAKKGLPPERRRRKFQGTFFERFNPFTDAP